MLRRLGNCGDALSQLANCLLLPEAWDTDANESISGRCYRRGWKRGERLINALVFWAPNHCQRAWEKDLERARRLLELAP